MEKNYVLNGNKLIAEFEYGKRYNNAEDIEDCYVEESETSMITFYLEDSMYHKSWDWLMPVAKKYWEYWDLQNSGEAKHLPSNVDYRHDCFTIGIDDIEDVFQKMVEFIKWYNKQNNKDMKKQT